VRLFLGVDGGGSKTAFCLVTDQGDLTGWHLAPSCDYLSSGIGLVARVLQQGIETVCRQAGIGPADIDHAFFGLPTYGEISADVAALDAAPRAVLGHDRYRCDNDMVCAWAGSLGGADGINVISGTGSISYGVRGDRSARVGGWGEVFGDEGSGYWIGVRGLQSFSRMSDGRLPPGPLVDVMRPRLGLGTDLDIVDLVLRRWRAGRTEVASLAPVVVDAARQGDRQAVAILQEAAAELVLLVEVTRRRLGALDTETIPVSWSGGVFNAPEILSSFRARLDSSPGSYDLREPLHPPAVGAALVAATGAGTPLTAVAVQRLHDASALASTPRPSATARPVSPQHSGLR
jgi:N-acetylglucosamine kinase-like BadF-type ATPase